MFVNWYKVNLIKPFNNSIFECANSNKLKALRRFSRNSYVASCKKPNTK